MIRALVIANHFPPIGGVGVQRAVQFADGALEHGIEPVILTGPGRSDGRWEPHDPSLLEQIGRTAVVRLAGPIPPARNGWRRRLERLSGGDSPVTRWWTESVSKVDDPVALDVDVILAELAPYPTAEAAATLARRLGVPWVADLQDPWALDEMWVYPTAVQRLRDRNRMRRSLSTAAAVVMNTPEAAARLLQEFPELGRHTVTAITNGFDARDFEGPEPVRSTESFKIVHTGFLHTELALQHRGTRQIRALLGGMPVPGVDFLTRSHVYLMQAVARLRERQPELGNLVEIHLVGAVSEADREVAIPFPFVTFHGFRPHAEAVMTMREAELLFLPMQSLPPGRRAGLVPGKTYEYMASGTPILAAVPPGDARDILESLGNADVCDPAAVDCLSDAIERRVIAWRAGTQRQAPNPEILARFEHRHLVQRLATVLHEVVGA